MLGHVLLRIVATGLLALMIFRGGAEAKPFTVADSIAMTRVNSGTWWVDNPPAQGVFYPSPDGSRTVFVLRNGNLVTGFNEYRLMMFRTDAVREYLNDAADAKRPTPSVLAQFNTAGWTYGIDRVAWDSHGRAVLFIGRGADEVGQVFKVSTESGALEQLTHHKEDIIAFALSADRRQLFYSARCAPEDWTDRNAHGYALTSNYVAQLSITDPREARPIYYRPFVLSLDTQRLVQVATPPGYYPSELQASPSGRWAVTTAPAKFYRSRWPDYVFIQEERRLKNQFRGPAVAALDDRHDETYELTTADVQEFFLIDMESGSAKSFVDAPSLGLTVGQRGSVWSADERRVLLAPVFLPLTGVDAKERERRARTQAVVEVEIETGRMRYVADMPDRLPGGQLVDTEGLERQPDGSVLIRQRQRTLGSVAPLPVRSFRDRNGRWAEVHRPEKPHETASVEFVVVQDLNTPPEIAARDVKTGRQRTLTAMNPQFQDLTFGHVETFQWRDRLSRTHVGGLVRPPDFVRGQRYPVVIQTYAFSPDLFLLEGPPLAAKAAFAAQALANRGMLVLQMPSNSPAPAGVEGAYSDTGENPRFLAMLESAIDALDAEGLIERDRVGLIGFSRSGMHVLNAITFSAYPIAAATVADSVTDTPTSYAMGWGLPGYMTDYEQNLIGAPFWGEGIKLWVERSSAFHWDRIRASLRLESYGPFVDNRWDTYALLKRFRRPVEFIKIPKANHVLTQPYAIYTSQEGNVDWFDFWLRDHEDPAADKSEQYGRWRMLRQQHEAYLSDLRLESANTQGATRRHSEAR